MYYVFYAFRTQYESRFYLQRNGQGTGPTHFLGNARFDVRLPFGQMTTFIARGAMLMSSMSMQIQNEGSAAGCAMLCHFIGFGIWKQVSPRCGPYSYERIHWRLCWAWHLGNGTQCAL